MRGIPDGWLDSPHAKAAAQRIGGLIERDFAASGLCAVKDPRMCLVAPLWIEAFETRGFEVDCLFVVRDPREVVESMHRRNKWPRAPLYLMWVQYLMEATAASEHRSRAMITYDRLLADWRDSMARVASGLHLRWPITPGRAVSEAVDAFLDPRRRHHQVLPREAGGTCAAMPELAGALYRACLGIASGEEKWDAISGRHDSYREIDQLYAAHVDHLLAERWGAEGRTQTAEARLVEQASVTTAVHDTLQALQERLDARFGLVEQNLKTIAQQAQAMEAAMAARWEAQASATGAVHGTVQQLQNEVSALSGETAARFDRQRESVMAVEARIQRQHALLNTMSLRLEQSANDRVAEHPVASDTLPQTELQKLRSALANSDATIAALFASSSWKLTAPMRWFSVHVLRRPPALEGPVAIGAPAAPESGGDRPPEAISVGRSTAGADAAAEPGAATARERRDRRDRRPESVAFRWM
ncbi:MAG TPA: hypothetical protein VFP92_13010 [Rhodanobacteraceae bacterium]|nr:hypothetical protein [Rhodanobacteraceae bacterium]